MAKNRNKKKNASTSMAVDNISANHTVMDVAQAMDTSETLASNSSVGGAPLRKLNKGRPMKRSKNVRKMKAIAKALSQTEKSEEKVSKTESKSLRTKFAKNLYD
ncbi:hypothetical protein ACJIZ3_012660 [Penstemon smallii]|uniref:Uncharacterized protein n=1 Tax=Penstemon smallii TaxID=265156 RepID=A0ABD3UQJ8_9LAMI